MTRLAVFLLLLMLSSAGMAQTPDWRKTWDETLAAAKKEGKVIVVGSPDPVMRNEIIPKFTARYGIPVDFIAAGSTGQVAARVRTERSSGLYSVDVFMSGLNTSVNVLYAEKMLDPLKPMLILPDVTDGAKWKRGKPWFMDTEGQFILMLFANVDSQFFINTDYVKPDEIAAAKDLLNPKWKGKIATEDLGDSGSGANTAGHFHSQLGADFVKKLYIDQKPAISRDRRQLTDWLARGTYPICLTCRADDARALQKEGFNILEVFELTDMRNRMNSSPFLLTVANRAPHPNATRVFVNWLAGREALEIYSRAYESPTMRTDVDESFLDPRALPRAGVDYVDNTEINWVATGRLEAANKVRALLKKP
jgi:iron(III) transport system substrate-binding protein